MDYFALPKIKKYLKELLHHLDDPKYSTDKIEGLVIDEYTYFKIATDFITSLENNDRDGLETAIDHLHELPRIKDRDRDIVRLRLIEDTAYTKIGEMYGISGNRVSQIVHKSLYIALCYIGDGHELYEEYKHLIMGMRAKKKT